MRCTKLIFDVERGIQRECGSLVDSGDRCQFHKDEDNLITMDSYRYTNNFLREHLTDDSIEFIKVECTDKFPGFMFVITYKDGNTGLSRWCVGTNEWTFGSIGETSTNMVRD